MADQFEPKRHPFKRLTWLLILISLNVTLFVLNSIALWKLYAYEPASPSLLDTLLRRPATPQLIDYKDFISIMLAGLGVMVTVLGIGLATIAVWGTATLKQEARTAAEKVAREDAAKVATEVATEVARDVAQSTAARGMRPVYDNVGAGDTDALVNALISADATSVEIPTRSAGGGDERGS